MLGYLEYFLVLKLGYEEALGGILGLILSFGVAF